MTKSGTRKRSRAEDDTLRRVSPKNNVGDSASRTVRRRARPIEQDSALLRLPRELLVHTLSYVLNKQEDTVKLHSAAARRWRNEAARLDIKPSCSCPQPSVRLTPEHHVALEHHNGKMVKQSRKLDLLLSCRALYFAGIEAFYTTNTLEFPSATALASFINSTGSDRRNAIRRVIVGMIWMSNGTGEGSHRALPSGYDVTCDFDELTLEKDILEKLPNLTDMLIQVYAKPTTIWTTSRNPSHIVQLDANKEIEGRIDKAWPSVRGKMTIKFL